MTRNCLRLRSALMLGLALSGAVQPSGASGQVRTRTYREVVSMDETVRTRIIPQLTSLLDQLLRDKRAMQLDHIPAFAAKDKFLPGKIAGALAYLLMETSRSDPRFASYLAGYRAVADMTVGDDNDSWGIYYYMSALYKLKQAGLLDQAISPPTLARLKVQLDWRRFVRTPSYSLVDLPNNYYGVAFSIARLRMLMGWEDASASDALFDRMLDHYRRYSGIYGFADETEGQGRFDRYSILLIGEIAQRLIETGKTPPPEVLFWLRRSVDLMLPRFTMTGEGFEYGRSIGPYGETCFLEVLTAAAKLGVLTSEEKKMAYAYSSRIAARYVDFWIDPETGSVNMWDKGRNTDAYRGKNRILGENLSLARQYIYTSEEWNELGFKGAPTNPGYAAWLNRLPRATLTWFARGAFDRALLTVRDGHHVIGLPLINGADGQHMNTPYFPVPESVGMLAGTPDQNYPQLVPEVELADGTTLMPLAWFEDVTLRRLGPRSILTYRQRFADRMGAAAPQKDDRLAFETRYVFEAGRIVRTDRLIAPAPLKVRRIRLMFAGFSSGPRVSGRNRVVYASGDVTQFEASGFDSCAARSSDGAPFTSPFGPMKSIVTCEKEGLTLDRAMRLGWQLTYR